MYIKVVALILSRIKKYDCFKINYKLLSSKQISLDQYKKYLKKEKQ